MKPPLNSTNNRSASTFSTTLSSTFSSKLHPAADVCVGFAILVIVVLSVLGNGLVLVISYRRRKKLVDYELLCINLAVVDFFCCICFYPLSILSSFNHTWLGHDTTCVYYGLGCYIFGLCSMFTIAAISITRYLKTCYSLVYAVWLEGANIPLLCCAIWLVATVWSCFPLFGWGEYVPEPYGLSCTIAFRAYHTSVKDAVYVICSFACFTLVPVLLIVVSQCHILYKVYHFSSSLSVRGIRNKLRYAEKRLSMMFFAISMGFVIAWAPYAVVSFLFIFHKDNWNMAPEGFVLPAIFAKSSHIYNPFIYFYFNKSFQQELRRLLCSHCPGLVRNQVGVRSATGHQAPHPIQIQLQEQGVQKKGFSLSQEKSQSKSTHTESNHLHGRVVYPCWVSTFMVGPITEHKHVSEFPSVSI
ncbi:opsin 8, group member c [Diretmus argenteus]